MFVFNLQQNTSKEKIPNETMYRLYLKLLMRCYPNMVRHPMGKQQLLHAMHRELVKQSWIQSHIDLLLLNMVYMAMREGKERSKREVYKIVYQIFTNRPSKSD